MRSMFRCEVFIPRTGGWIALDETAEPTTRRTYERQMRRAFPILAKRQWRVVPSGKAPARTLFTLSVEL